MTKLWDRDREPRLLFLEDDTALGNMFKIYFSQWAEVTIAIWGSERLAHYSSQSFDLLILDLDLHSKDAQEFMKSVRVSGKRVPVFILAQKDMPSNQLRELGIDADDHMRKPFDIEELKLRISSILNRLAGDTTTDAPPPEKEKKRDKKNQ